MIRWGIIGCGDVTELKSGPGFQQARNSALVAVMRRDGEKAADYARRHGVPRWYDDADRMIADPEVDAVAISTPPSSHLELALRVAAAGKPALVEKPMACSHDECRQMIRSFTTARQPLFVAYYRRALPKFLKIKSLIEAGMIGRIRSVSVTHRQRPLPFDPDNLPWRYRPEISGGGLFVDLASHTLDYLDFLFGPITVVDGHAIRQADGYEVEDAVSASFVHSSGVHGCGSWNFNSYEDVDSVRIDGSGGAITFSVFAPNATVVTAERGNESFTISNPPAIQQPLIQAVVDELESRGPSPSTGETAARTNWVMDEILGRRG